MAFSNLSHQSDASVFFRIDFSVCCFYFSAMIHLSQEEHEEFLHPLWLGLIMLFAVILGVGMLCIVRRKYGAQLCRALNRFCGTTEVPTGKTARTKTTNNVDAFFFSLKITAKSRSTFRRWVTIIGHRSMFRLQVTRPNYTR